MIIPLAMDTRELLSPIELSTAALVYAVNTLHGSDLIFNPVFVEVSDYRRLATFELSHHISCDLISGP